LSSPSSCAEVFPSTSSPPSSLFAWAATFFLIGLGEGIGGGGGGGRGRGRVACGPQSGAGGAQIVFAPLERLRRKGDGGKEKRGKEGRKEGRKEEPLLNGVKKLSLPFLPKAGASHVLCRMRGKKGKRLKEKQPPRLHQTEATAN
jgi:hypothetical protein